MYEAGIDSVGIEFTWAVPETAAGDVTVTVERLTVLPSAPEAVTVKV